MQWLPSHFQMTHDMSALPFRYGELCQVIKVTPTISDQQMRLKLTNRYGRKGLVFDQVQVADNPQFRGGRSITCRHQQQILIPAQQVIRTDPLDYQVIAGHPLYLKMVATRPQLYVDFASTYQTTVTNAALSRHHDFVPPLSERWHSRKGWFSFEALEVATSARPFQIELTGDSLVESGMVVAELIQHFNQITPNQICWLQTGISGNQLCHDAPMEEPLYETFGRSLLKRFQKPDRQTDLTIALIGTNDLILPFYSKTMAEQNITPKNIINGFQQLQKLCQARMNQLLTTTIAPLRLFDLPDPLPAEQIITRQRRAINAWLRQQPWIVDGARHLRDAQDNLAAKYDFGDHLHWGPTGGKVMAQLLIPRIENMLMKK